MGLAEAGMMKKRHFGNRTVTWCLCLLIASGAHADLSLITNGSFELTNVDWTSTGVGPVGGPEGHYIELFAGSTAINGWTVTGYSIDYGMYWFASDGDMSIDLIGHQPGGGIQQSFATVPGQEYEVVFDMAGHPHAPSESRLRRMGVSAAGQNTVFDFDANGYSYGNMGWTEKSWFFTASDTQTTLRFYSVLGIYDGGPALDNVRVYATPVPGAALLGVLGLCCAGWRLRRRAM
jgi:choice-of-anchor C domain-containing protein